jgi:hypothetical protein
MKQYGKIVKLQGKVLNSTNPEKKESEYTTAGPICTALHKASTKDSSMLFNKFPLSESFVCNNVKEVKSYIGKVCPNKSRQRNMTSIKGPIKLSQKLIQTKADNKENKSADIIINIDKCSERKGTLLRTNGTFVNNDEVKRSSFISYKELANKSKDVDRLERKLKKRLNEDEDKFEVYSSFFNEIIEEDLCYRQLLKQIKGGYEEKHSELKKQLAEQRSKHEFKLSALNNEMESQRQMFGDKEDQMLRELKEKDLRIKELEEVLKAKKEQIARPLEKKRSLVKIPKLDLSRIKTQVEDIEVDLNDFDLDLNEPTESNKGDMSLPEFNKSWSD